MGSCTLEAERTAAGFWLKQFETWVDYRETVWDPETRQNTDEVSDYDANTLFGGVSNDHIPHLWVVVNCLRCNTCWNSSTHRLQVSNKVVKALITVGSNYSLQTTESIFKRDCEQLVHSMTTAFDVTNAMKLVSLRFFGYNQTSLKQANIFASGIDLTQPYNQFALSRSVEVREQAHGPRWG